VSTGPRAIHRAQPLLSASEREIVNRFHELYYQRWVEGGDTINLTWFGHALWKCPLDLWMYQELIVRTRPDVLVETGTYEGGSALFFATLFDRLGDGRVITIDVEPRPAVWPMHHHILHLTGSSIDPAVVRRVRDEVGAATAMVVLDSDHTEAHVYGELSAYHDLVRPGHYLVVEDTNVNGHPAYPAFGPGPAEAVTRFLAEHTSFQVDATCERFLMTLNPGGYLLRVE
jgi:cephalosporin hydroxylase